MVYNKRKKNSRHRGSWTHGYGEKKKHRGAGSRGGRGNAGSGKRGDAKKPSYWKIRKFSGKHGFVNPVKRSVHTTSLAKLNSSIHNIVESGNAIQEGNAFKVNLDHLGIDKLLGTGKPFFAYHLIVAQATKGAIKKVEAKGGSVQIIAPSTAESEDSASQKKDE